MLFSPGGEFWVEQKGDKSWFSLYVSVKVFTFLYSLSNLGC